MAKIISFSNEKGGCSKTTTSGVVAFLLSQTSRVLCVDMDSQGNLTELLTGIDSAEFTGRSIFEAIKTGDASAYRAAVSNNLHVIGGQTDLALLPRWLYSEYRGDSNFALRNTLAPILDEYDYVIIDTPPALGEQTINALAASDYVCAMYETSKYCYSALARFLTTVATVQEHLNPNLNIAGIVVSMIDKKRADNKALLDLVVEEYKDLCFRTIIYRRAATGRLSINGFIDNPELKAAVHQFRPLLDEVISRCR